jgi:cellulose synthase/poly-beta-1,6-N-acetylglucosamine synthase-like glycosyltransferase
MGTGMAIPWALISGVPGLGTELAEDLVMGLELALQGYPPVFCVDSQIFGDLPSTKTAAKQQRVRWEHGHLSTLFRYGPRLLWRGLRSRRLGLISSGLDLMIPPLALLVAAQLGLLIISLIILAFGGSVYPALAAGASVVFVAWAVVLGWACFARGLIPFHALALAPAYLLWKAPIYFAYFGGRREREWRRTDRS